MLRGLILENFKAFGGRRVIPIKPITLIFGPNSAGKSAIVQSLFLYKHLSSTSRRGNDDIQFVADDLNLGSYKNLIFNHDRDRELEITPLFDSSNVEKSYLSQGAKRNIAGIGVRLRLENQDVVGVVDTPIYLEDDSAPAITFLSQQEWNAHFGTFLEKYSGLLSGLFEADEGRWWGELDRDEIQALQLDLFSHVLASSESLAFVPPRRKGASPELECLPFALESAVWERHLRRFQAVDGEAFSDLQADDVAVHIEELTGELSRSIPNWRVVQEQINISESTIASFLVRLNCLNGSKVFTRAGVFPVQPIDNPLDAIGAERLRDLFNADCRDRRDLFRYFAPSNWNLRQPSLADLTERVMSSASELCESLVRIGPLRQVPSRFYVDSGTGAFPHLANQALSALNADQDLVQRVNNWFANLELKYRIKVQRFVDSERPNDHSSLFSVLMTTVDGELQSHLTDVGFGFSQMLPVLVGILVNKDKVIVVEQPELHLHPGLQAKLGDAVVESALLNHNTLVIETHSEQLVLRLMRRIRETAQGRLPHGFQPVTADDVSIIYVHPQDSGTGSIPIPIELDEEGNLMTAWPGGFFEEGFQERFS